MEDESQQEEEDKVQIDPTPPRSPAYVFNQVSKAPTYGMGTKGFSNQTKRKSRSRTRTLQTAIKSVGGTRPTLFRPSNKAPGVSLDDVSSAGGAEVVDHLFEDDTDARRQTKTEFMPMERPCEYCEMHYYASVVVHRPDLVIDNKFWLELAIHILSTKSFEGFLSGSFYLTASNISEIVFSCGFLDLPFQSSNHSIKSNEDRGVKIKFSSRAMLFKKEIKKAASNIQNKVHAIHRFFHFGNEHDENEIKTYTTHQAYGCEVIVTNVTSKKQTFQLLWQIPEGSLPLQNVNYQKSENHTLNPYSTYAFKYYFYFPNAGEYIHFPSNVSIEDKVVAVSNTRTFKVVSSIENTSESSLITANVNVLYDYLRNENLLKEGKGFSFDLIYWRLKEKEVYHEIINILRERRIYVQNIWVFSFYHKDPQGVKEFITKSENLCRLVGSNFSSSLYENHYTKHEPRHLEYFPLVNARSHSFGDINKSNIANNEQRQQYDRFLLSTIEKPKIGDSEKLCFTYYLLLQDRIQEAIDVFSKIDVSNISEDGSMVLQYDYMSAYLDFYTGTQDNLGTARIIAEKYKDYPVHHWKYLFDEIRDQINEYDGNTEYDPSIDQDDE